MRRGGEGGAVPIWPQSLLRGQRGIAGDEGGGGGGRGKECKVVMGEGGGRGWGRGGGAP